MRRRAALLCGLLLCAAAVAADGRQHTLVLVSAPDSVIATLTPADARKAYLGVPVIVEGQRVEALRNRSDALLDEVFLQKVVFLSAAAYERQVLSRVFRLGGEKPPSYERMDDLLEALRGSRAAVTYLWAETLAQYPGLRVVATLWQGPVE